jgi:O-methyltransferase
MCDQPQYRRKWSLRRWLEPYVHWCYVRCLRPLFSRKITQQRLKLLWRAWGYLPLLRIASLGPIERVKLVARFLRVDWHVLHAHSAYEISAVCRALAERPARPGEVLVEAGCWNGGASAKFSIWCKILGYGFCVYDSFEGVEPMTPAEKQGNYDFSGQYAAPESRFRENLRRYGEIDCCRIYKGWFKDTLKEVPFPVRVAYIDCDLAKGTREVLGGIIPALVGDGRIFSQDFHIRPVQELLRNPATWTALGKTMPAITQLERNLASICFGNKEDAPGLNSEKPPFREVDEWNENRLKTQAGRHVNYGA